MPQSNLRSKMKLESALKEIHRSPTQRLRELQSYRKDAWKLFSAGLKALGFSRDEIFRLWRQPSPRNASR